jgi:hypothetical protein
VSDFLIYLGVNRCLGSNPSEAELQSDSLRLLASDPTAPALRIARSVETDPQTYQDSPCAIDAFLRESRGCHQTVMYTVAP